MQQIAGIIRSEAFSPNSNDLNIICKVADLLREKNFEVTCYKEEEYLQKQPAEKIIFSMARSKATLKKLGSKEQAGALVINSAEGVDNCLRPVITELMKQKRFPMPQSLVINLKNAKFSFIKYPCWLKRGDTSAQQKEDVSFVRNEKELQKACDGFKARGIMEAVLSEHVEGDVVKFYGVANTEFFYWYYPTLGQKHSKFGLEEINGPAQQFPFNVKALKKDADRLAVIADTPVYGGDCIVDSQGIYKIIDFNDWPSYSCCLDEAAQAIVNYITKRIDIKNGRGKKDGSSIDL